MRWCVRILIFSNSRALVGGFEGMDGPRSTSVYRVQMTFRIINEISWSRYEKLMSTERENLA